MIKFLRKMMSKKCKGFDVSQLMIYIVVITIILKAGTFAFSTYQDRARLITTRQELTVLANAIVAYEADHISSKLPSNLGDLVKGLTADEANDGIAKEAYVKKDGWTTDATSFKDAWGNAYVYSATDRTITSTANGKTSIVKKF
jgi:type II secretory pathway pseudopilin PulG